MRRWHCAAGAGGLGAVRADVAVDRGATEPLARLEQHLTPRPPGAAAGRERGTPESLLELLRDHHIMCRASTRWLVRVRRRQGGDRRRASAAGFQWLRDGEQTAIEFITETELFSTAPTSRRRRKQEQVSNVDALIKDLSELKVGDPVVHINHASGAMSG